MAKQKETKKKIHSTSKLAKTHDEKLVQPNPYLETQREHKDWYAANIMGKQRGKPRYDMAGKKIKKKKGGD